MSQLSPEPRAIADAVFEAINSGDLDAFMALAAEDVEFTSMVAEAEGTTFRGRDGLRAWWETIRGAFQNVRWELIDFRATGDRAVTHIRMAGTLSGVPVEQTMWQAVKLRDGKVAWWASFRSEREALEAARLRDQAMSQENVEPATWIETARRAIEAWNRQDLDAFLDTWHADCVWRPAFPRSLEGVGTVYRGREGVARAWHGVRAVWDEYRLDPEDAQLVGERLVLVGRVYAHGRESGLDLDSGWSALATYRDGLAISAFDWLDRDAAFEAVGLRE